MDETIQIFLVAAIGALATILAAVISRGDMAVALKPTALSVEGQWHGISVYVPIDSYSPGSEAIYKFDIEFQQTGSRLRFREWIQEIRDTEGTLLPQAGRVVKGKGRVVNDRDIIMEFVEEGSLTRGTFYLTADNWVRNVSGVITVRNPHFGAVATVKVLMRRKSEPVPTLAELGWQRLKEFGSSAPVQRTQK